MNLLNMNIKSTFKYQVIFFLSAAIHITFFLLFIFNGIYILAFFNIFSIAFYLFGGILSRGSVFKKYNLALNFAIYIEITAHAILATMWLGMDSCFFLYNMDALTVASYIIYLSSSRDKFFKVIMPMAAVTFTALAISYVFLIFKQPLITLLFDRELSAETILLMRGVNIFITVFVMFFFSLVFIAEMHNLMDKLEKTNRQLNYTANHDALTDLYNRHSLKELFRSFINSIRASSAEDLTVQDGSDNIFDIDIESVRFCVIMGDVDNFKAINDTYGHSCGDKVLKTVASAIKNGVSDIDIACRWGGEEFLILMSGEKEQCTERVEAIRRNIESIHLEEEPDLIVTMTFGLVCCSEMLGGTVRPGKVTKIDKLVQIADSRLYDGKHKGKNVVVFQ